MRLVRGRYIPESAEELKAAHAFITEDVRSVLGPKAAVKFYASAGSPNPKFVRKEIEAWKVRLRDEGAIPGKTKKRK